MRSAVVRFVRGFVLAGVSATACVGSALATPQTPPHQDPGTPAAHAPVVPNSVMSSRQAVLLRHRWGIEDLHVRYTASGSLVRFSWRVVNAEKAAILNDKKAEPSMIVKKTGARLGVPETERVGKLRQTAAPEEGREYWMVFTNVGRALKPGDHVDIVIGAFHVNELVVESANPHTSKAASPGHKPI